MLDTSILGATAKDGRTGFCGVVTSITASQGGPVKVLLTPPAPEPRWFELSQLQLITYPKVVLSNGKPPSVQDALRAALWGLEAISVDAAAGGLHAIAKRATCLVNAAASALANAADTAEDDLRARAGA